MKSRATVGELHLDRDIRCSPRNGRGFRSIHRIRPGNYFLSRRQASDAAGETQVGRIGSDRGRYIHRPALREGLRRIGCVRYRHSQSGAVIHYMCRESMSAVEIHSTAERNGRRRWGRPAGI